MFSTKFSARHPQLELLHRVLRERKSYMNVEIYHLASSNSRNVKAKDFAED